ncbi:hypothetical protein [Streptomyces sp. TRM70350]|uniref:hypothetical protein n=1 Tax=Streptomyces sp. TRM70350 TaxID=2856165 RepID=UPI001C46567C|nr:hypothetical protein [Streptomyces sp. TRM70350]MBV7697350.1 hypothetical protein [Streptomyces sp. TRM70350]
MDVGDADSESVRAQLYPTSHFHALRAVTPLLSRDGALVHLSGFSAEIPYPFSALVGATNAAKKSLVTFLTAELDGAGPRTCELIIGPIRTRRVPRSERTVPIGSAAKTSAGTRAASSPATARTPRPRFST